ncbi:hypothetical protein GW932_00545 [archaeon]|nr:hypothetical protein [archaeon]
MKKKKSFKDIWEVIEFPLIFLLIWALLNMVLDLQNLMGKVFYMIISWAITILVFGYVGYQVVKNKEDEKASAKHGAYLGAFYGIISAIIGIISFYVFPEKIEEAIRLAAEQGVDPNVVRTFAKVGVYASLVFSPLFTAAIGALISWISGLIFKKK